MTPLPIHKLLDYHPVVYCIIDKDDCFTHASATTTEILGYPLQELIGAPFLNFVIEQDREKTQRALQYLRDGRFVDKFENRYYHKDGSIVTIRWSSQWDAEEQQLYSIGHTMISPSDAEQLRQAFSKKIKQANARFSEAFEHIQDGFCTLDEDWRFIYANKASAALLQKPIEDLLAHVVWDCFPEAVGTIVEQEYRRCFEQRVQVSFETFYPEPLNKWFGVIAYPSAVGISVFFRDITEHKKSEEEMRKLSLIVRNTDNLVMLCDNKGRLKWVNEAFEQKTGYLLHEVFQKRLGDFLSGPGTNREVIKRMRNKYKTGEPFREEVLFYTKSKAQLWVYVSGQTIYNDDGGKEELFAILTDISERKQLEQQLALEQEVRQRKITTAVIQTQEQERSEIGKELHDNVNQLLTTVKLYLDLSLSPEMAHDALVKKSIQLVQRSIDEIRCLSKRLSAPTVEKTTLGESVRELCDTITITNQFGISLDASDVDFLEVAEDLHLALYRILQEHLTNILKHAAAKNVAVTLKFDEGFLVLKVRDDGKGFETGQKRAGIGITNMVTRAESLGGSLTIVSAPGAGTELVSRLPLRL